MERKIWTAEELETLSHAERRRISNESVVTDAESIDHETIRWARAVADAHMASSDPSSAT